MDSLKFICVGFIYVCGFDDVIEIVMEVVLLIEIVEVIWLVDIRLIVVS